MKLWLLEPKELPDENNPWAGGYDRAYKFVVRAVSEEEARRLAYVESGAESKAWLNSELSDCVPLKKKGDAGVICRDFSAA